MASMGEDWNRDTLVGILGAAVLVAAMAGVFLYERGQFQEFDVSWEAQEAGAQTFDDNSLQEGNSADHPVTIAAADLADGRALARIRATVDWTDDVGDPDTFAVSVQGPGDRSAGPTSDDGGSVTVLAPVATMPERTTASGRTAEDAADQAASTMDASDGLGEWTATVELQDAPGDPDDGNPVTTEQTDGSQSYTLTLAWDIWEPVVTG